MKKLQFYALSLLLSGCFITTSCQDDDTTQDNSEAKIEMQKNMQQFLTSVEIAPKGRIAINDLQSLEFFL
ncbi:MULTISPECIES: hypothetical protein [unclassified Empedobacter]|uniref:hypothetical protein n=1 Tax=unclassified Empedobacter TaxID=2643773 RepID=UPI0025C1089A|nr:MULTISPECIES: hypothetical protein [unclassified Empedobacter]